MKTFERFGINLTESEQKLFLDRLGVSNVQVSMEFLSEFIGKVLSQIPFQNYKMLERGFGNIPNEKDIKDHRFLIEGHTDAKGSQNYNLLLSKRRANSVKSFLIANGIAEQRLTVDGKGALDLIDPVNPYSASNRIVRLIDLR
jgi:hypothetical protein